MLGFFKSVAGVGVTCNLNVSNPPNVKWFTLQMKKTYFGRDNSMIIIIIVLIEDIYITVSHSERCEHTTLYKIMSNLQMYSYKI